MIELTMIDSPNPLIEAASAERVAVRGGFTREGAWYRAVRYHDVPGMTFLRAVEQDAALVMPCVGRLRAGDRVAVDRSPYVVRLLEAELSLVAKLEPL